MCELPGDPGRSTRPSTGFQKPSNDGDGFTGGPSKSSIPAWKKSTKLTCKPDSVENPLPEKGSSPGEAVTAAQDGLHGGKSVKRSRLNSLYFVNLKLFLFFTVGKHYSWVDLIVTGSRMYRCPRSSLQQTHKPMNLLFTGFIYYRLLRLNIRNYLLSRITAFQASDITS